MICRISVYLEEMIEMEMMSGVMFVVFVPPIDRG